MKEYLIRKRWRRRWLFFLVLAAIALGIIAFFYPKSNTACPFDESCIPDFLTLENLTVTHSSNLTGITMFSGDVICETPLWPSCLDISGQSCMTPLQESCYPSSLTELNVSILTSQTTVLNGETTCPNGPVNSNCIPLHNDTIGPNTTCDGPIPNGCIPTDLVLESLVVQNLTTYNFTNIITTVLNQTLISTENLVVNQSLTCGMDNIIGQNCFDISGKSCSTPLEPDCVPGIPSSKITTCDVEFPGACVNISGKSCAEPLEPSCYGAIPSSKIECDISFNETCMPSSLTLDNLVVNNLTVVNFTSENIVIINQTTVYENDITFNGTVSCGSEPFNQSCIPTIPTSKLECDISLSGPCLDISGKSCTLPVNANCVDISGETCMSPVDQSCIPQMDVQAASSNTTDTISSPVYADMDSMNLTTLNSGRYLVFANLQVTQTTSSAVIYIVFNINGLDQVITERNTILESMDPSIVPMIEFFPSLSNGDVIKIRWRITGPGSVNVNNRRLIIQQV